MKTPVPHHNRPGLDALRYRVGIYGDFLQSMLARLSHGDEKFRPLNRLRTRSPDDPTIALIDAFAGACELLTFYQERLANEGYLRTAKERRSLEELARLTGYRLRPGVASSVCFAFTLDANSSVTIPAGSRAQSVPGPGQTAQSFETSDELVASGAWNAMRPRLTRPTQAAVDLSKVAVAGTNTSLKPNDPVLLVIGSEGKLRRVQSIEPNFDRKRTVINLQPLKTATPPSTSTLAASTPAALWGPAATSPQTLLTQCAEWFASRVHMPPAAHPPNAQALTRLRSQLFGPGAEASLALTAGVSPAQRAAVFRALAQAPLAEPTKLEVHAFRASTAPFGNRAPPQVSVDANGRVQPPEEWQISGPIFGPEVLFSVEIAVSREQPPRVAAFLREFSAILARGRTPSDSVGLISTITFDDATLEIPLPLLPNSPVTRSLSDRLGDVTVTLNRLEGRTRSVWEFLYDFNKQPLTLSVRVEGTIPPTATVSNLRQTNAQVTLRTSEDFAESSLDLRVLGSLRPVVGTQPAEMRNVLHLDGTFETITPGTWVACDMPADSALPWPPCQVNSVSTVSRVAYGQTARCSRLVLSGDWIDPDNADFAQAIRGTAVYADSTQLSLVDEDIIDEPIPRINSADSTHDPTLELDGLVTGLIAGQWLVVSGERTELPGGTSAELVMLASVSHGGEPASPGDENTVKAGETPHTTLTFASPLAYVYKRDTVQVFGNVVAATQGEGCDEILGSGDGSAANQSFTLKKPPVTYVPAVTPSGSASTLRIWVNNIEWHEINALAGAASEARVYATYTAENGSVTVQFGDGVHGARLPTGPENIRARYRSGLGLSGNLGPGTITNLLSRPLGVTGVTNPIPASGGADAESPDDARRNVPLGLVSLARLVSVSDYQDFALAFGGVGKAAAARFSGPDGPLIHLTLAGAQDATLERSSKLWQNLEIAIRKFGDAELEVELAPRAARLALIQAGVAVDADHLWSDVEPLVRAALLDAFSFTRRALGQTLYASEVIATIQGVPGVSYVDLQTLTSVSQPTKVDQLQAAMAARGIRDLVAHAARVDPGATGRPRKLLPAELIYLSGVLPDMALLSEVKP